MTRLERNTGATGRVTRILLTTTAIVCIGAAGCGDGRPRRAPVSGQVLIDGKPLTYGFVQLLPKGARPAVGEIGEDGRFTLSTFEDGDGAVLGTHAVRIQAGEQISSNRMHWHAPKKWNNPHESGLRTTIDGPTDSLLIEISWEGGKPFEETSSKGE
jgi:hypothetical protein